MKISDYLDLLSRKQNLSDLEARNLLTLLLKEDTTTEQIAKTLKAFAEKGETVEEIAAFAEGMRELMLSVKSPRGTVDIVGTGGDGSNSFNISTASAIVVAACGVPVAKH